MLINRLINNFLVQNLIKITDLLSACTDYKIKGTKYDNIISRYQKYEALVLKNTMNVKQT